jgi:hypothetical protein
MVGKRGTAAEPQRRDNDRNARDIFQTIRFLSMVVSPYGFWNSSITYDLVVIDVIRFDQVALDGNAIYWTESQPQKRDRYFVYRVLEGEEPELVTPTAASTACRLPLLEHRSSYQLFLRRYFSWQPPQSFLPISPNTALNESRSFTFVSAALESLPNLGSVVLKSSMFFQISGLAL